MKREKLSTNFYRDEFACKCGCGKVAINLYLVECLQRIRNRFNVPITITSGYRCPAHNKVVGGSKSSRHMLGLAADIRVGKSLISREPTRVKLEILGMFNEPIGLGTYDTFVHFDVLRAKDKRWTG